MLHTRGFFFNDLGSPLLALGSPGISPREPTRSAGANVCVACSWEYLTFFLDKFNQTHRQSGIQGTPLRTAPVARRANQFSRCHPRRIARRPFFPPAGEKEESRVLLLSSLYSRDTVISLLQETSSVKIAHRNGIVTRSIILESFDYCSDVRLRRFSADSWSDRSPRELSLEIAS